MPMFLPDAEILGEPIAEAAAPMGLRALPIRSMSSGIGGAPCILCSPLCVTAIREAETCIGIVGSPPEAAGEAA